MTQVRTNPENGRGSVLFDGPEDAAREFVRNNFPRMHSEPGSEPRPDVVLDSGASFDGDKWSDEGKRSSSSDSSAPRKAPARKAGAKR